MNLTNLRTPDPSLHDTGLQVDVLTWRRLISGAMTELYGIVGNARHYDILGHQSSLPSKSALIRVQREDEQNFLNALAAYSFAMSDHFGSEYDVPAYILVKKSTNYLSELVDI